MEKPTSTAKNLICSAGERTPDDRHSVSSPGALALSSDHVTPSHSREAIEQRIQTLLNDGRAVGALFVAVDGVQDASRMHGYRIARSVIERVAAKAGEWLGEEYRVEIWGDSELLAVTSRPQGDALLWAGNLVSSQLAHGVQVGREHIPLSARVGAALSTSILNAEALIRHVMLATPVAASAKAKLYSPSMAHCQQEQHRLQGELSQAAMRGELQVHYQSQIDLATRAVVGAEALLRWEHPRFGRISPGDFIGIAENSGDIVPIGEWVIDTVAHQVAEWQQEGVFNDQFRVAINVAPRQLIEPDFANRFCDIVSAAGVSPHSFEVEVTESGLMMQLEKAKVQLSALRRSGVGVAIDDFGTGASSLSYLQQLPVGTLKIDRSFIRGLAKAESGHASWNLVEAIKHLAHGQGCNVVAEGIETRHQHEQLRKMGCETGQGYLYDWPMAAVMFQAFHMNTESVAQMMQADYPSDEVISQ